MRLLHYLSTVRLSTGGVARAVLDLCAALARAGHEVTLASWSPDDVPAEWRRDAGAVPTPGLPRVLALERPALPGGFFAPGQLRPLRAALASVDVVHLHGMWLRSTTQVARAARRACRGERAGVPYVITPHGQLDDWTMAQRGLKKRAYMALLARPMLDGASAVHCTAEDELRQSRRWFPRTPGVVAPLVFDLSLYRELPGPGPARARWPLVDAALRESRPLVLFLSRLHVKKGVEHLVRAVALLRAQGIDATLVIAGAGEPDYERALRGLIEREGLGGREGLSARAELIGFASGIEKVSLLQSATVFALPTSQENFGYVLFESMAAGTPVVTTRLVDTAPELERSGGAVLVEQSPGAIAQALGGLIGDGARREAMGAAGRAWTLAFFDEARVVLQLERMYAGIISGGVPTRPA